MKSFKKVFPAKVESAIATLANAGFAAFTEAKIGDVRELDSGSSRRTFRHEGRYRLVLALRDMPENSKGSK